MEVFDFGLRWPCRLASTREHIRHPTNGLPLPCADLVRMKLMLRSDLLYGLVATQRFQRNLGLKLVCKIPALCLLRIPSIVWDTPWLTVQFSGTTSAFEKDKSSCDTFEDNLIAKMRRCDISDRCIDDFATLTLSDTCIRSSHQGSLVCQVEETQRKSSIATMSTSL